ncbi:MAG: hypothetical protein RR197_07205, partial [Oscillospiraceae bacterium]
MTDCVQSAPDKSSLRLPVCLIIMDGFGL